MSGYSFDSNSSCLPTCGDGILKICEDCDDGNLNDNDGCSSTCKLEDRYACFQVNGTSFCSLLSLGISFVSLLKDPDSNSITIIYQIQPAPISAFSTLDWSAVVYQQSNLSVYFRSFTFETSTGRLIINANYSQPIDA